MKALIYKITSPDGEIYIGQTRNLSKRLCDYRATRKVSLGALIYKSVLKHSFDKHRFEILHEFSEGVSRSEMDEKEIFFIAKFRSEGCPMLNITDGGSGISGYKHTAETIAKMQLNNVGAGNPNYGKGLHGKNNPRYGIRPFGESNGMYNRQHKEESILKMRANIKSKKPVLQIDVNGNIINEWPSVSEAARNTGLCKPNILKVCNGKGHLSGGFVWKFKTS